MSISDNAVEVAPDPASSRRADFWHCVQIYENETFLAETVSRFIGKGLEGGEGVVVIATKPHGDAFEERLQARGLDVRAARARGQYLLLEASETLERFRVDSWLDPERFAAVVGKMMQQALAGGTVPRVRIFGEMVSRLWEAEQQAVAIRLEELWNELAKTHPFSLLCAYPRSGFRDDVAMEAFLKVCAEHSHVFPAESYSREEV